MSDDGDLFDVGHATPVAVDVDAAPEPDDEEPTTFFGSSDEGCANSCCRRASGG